MGSPTGAFPRKMPSWHLPSRSAPSSWFSRAVAVLTGEQLVADVGAPGIVPVLVDAPPFDRTGREDRGGGFGRLTSVGRHRLVQVVTPGPRTFRAGPGNPVVAPAGHRTKLLVLTPRGGHVDVVLEVERPPGSRSAPILCRVAPGSPGRVRYRRARKATTPEALDLTASGSAVVPVDASHPLTTLVLTPERRPVRLVSAGLRPGAP
jgi:hypothetical protein